MGDSKHSNDFHFVQIKKHYIIHAQHFHLEFRCLGPSPLTADVEHTMRSAASRSFFLKYITFKIDTTVNRQPSFRLKDSKSVLSMLIM